MSFQETFLKYTDSIAIEGFNLYHKFKEKKYLEVVPFLLI